MRIGVLIVFMVALALSGLIPGKSQAETASPVYLVDIDAMINPGSLALLEHAIETAETNAAAALIVRINTPGGMLSTTRDMVRAIADSRVPVIGYVGPSGASATSAGAFILLSTHMAVMNTGTNVGAASPVAGDGGDIDGTLGKKVMNDSKAFMRSIANDHHRNADIAERFVSEAKSLTAQEALQAEVIDQVVPVFSELLQAVDGRDIQVQGKKMTLTVAGRDVRQIEPRLIDYLLKMVAHPQIAHLLISFGLLAIYVEMLSPGLTLPGVLGGIAVVLGLIGVQALPVNVGFLLLMLFGMTLMVAEYFVAGFGVLGIGGAAAFILGSLNLFDAPISTDEHDMIMTVSMAVSAAMLFATLIITGSLAFGKRKQRHLEGQCGEAMVNFDRSGYVLVGQQRWAADTMEPLQHGDPIVVVKQDKHDRLLVKKLSQSS
ncbi:MAG: nodulation protein NfeD [Methylococcales bacterium]|nr:nodulation protein NfeD [Methylococcales bacterium]